MFSAFIRFVRTKKNGKIITAIRNTALYKKTIGYIWALFVLHNYYPPKNNFYIENAERINAVEDMLADCKSKRTYRGIMKYRHSRKIWDYPFFCQEYTEYFIRELKLTDDEVFIDCGAYDGDTLDAFLKHCSDFRRIIAFEPQARNFELIEKKYGDNQKITLINAGVYDKDGELLFYGEDGSSSSGIDEENGNVKIKVKAIDNLNLEYVSFIKMDIEGAEYNALKGARETILRDKPKLAICIYHSDDDMIRIAEYIHELVPEYKLYVRQHSPLPNFHEVVLYAFYG